MKINNPKVTLDDDARIGVKEDVRSGFLDWLFRFVVRGDDGEFYSLGGSILSMELENLDLVSINWTKGKGNAVQLKNSIYKVGNYPGGIYEQLYRNPKGTLKIKRNEDRVVVTCGKEYEVECFEDNHWHFRIESKDGSYKAELDHIPFGYPLWYGRENPSYLTQHSITYGYNWSGNVKGTIWLNDKEIKVEGKGIRERYVAVDSSAAELGGWEDWGFFAFDEIHSSMYDMRLGMKDFAIYDIEKEKYYPEGNMIINHEDWVFVRDLGGFVPSKYNIKIEVEDGLYEINANVCNVTTWGVTNKVPDNPVGTLIYDRVEGSFTDQSGNVRILTNGFGALSIRQWHAYPNILPPELFSDEEKDIPFESKFDTL